MRESRGIRGRRRGEKSLDLARPELNRLQMGTDIVLEFTFTAGAGSLTDRAFQVAVEQFVRVVLRGIGGANRTPQCLPYAFQAMSTPSSHDEPADYPEPETPSFCCRVPSVA